MSEDKKDVVKSSGAEPLTIRLREQTGEETFFKIKTTTKMSKVFDAFLQKKGLQPETVRFTMDGDNIDPTDTPATLGLEDQDMIDCFLAQVGGLDVVIF
mmetsp:Transcript_94/g.166  ORF Transcript_94/g.166 Transcript_94/m.166 type:complete len:99 (+) Transcript_94:136-432(+)|eukprot:CAMPEP_0176500954 /NCGR_PEP_ID=MMETSP0200_2-20121128/13875_1 /TAXON_ID=947934 /ORGANISM="Chaetoceros sp., Strain GSL56" /LENGTH=98 /DNA_ID=CAMNT_0017899753 /DNA_START=122 /DNA_END=421 /DNA_ORIENTATION=+